MLPPIFETALILLLATAGSAAAWGFARLKDWRWTLGFFLSFPLILFLIAGGHVPAIRVTSVGLWLSGSRAPWAMLAFAGPMCLGTPVARLERHQRRIQVFAISFLAVVLSYFVLLPFLLPAFGGLLYSPLNSRSEDGVCLQSNSWTCGPAAVVTALRQFDINATESELAAVARSTPVAGTPPSTLVRAVESGWPDLQAEWRSFDSLDDMAPTSSRVVVACVKFTMTVDHYVTVLEVNGESVTFGDPLSGVETLSRSEFLETWRRTGIVINRQG